MGGLPVVVPGWPFRRRGAGPVKPFVVQSRGSGVYHPGRMWAALNTTPSLGVLLLLAPSGCGGTSARPDGPSANDALASGTPPTGDSPVSGASAGGNPRGPSPGTPPVATGSTLGRAARSGMGGAVEAPQDLALHRSLRPTAFADRLIALGHDPNTLAPISNLSAPQKLESMELIAESLGVECGHCHVSDNDYKTETVNKQIARQMWDRLTAGHRLDDGQLFCDSCHQGAPKVLQRARKKDVKAYMRAEYGRLILADGERAECEDCHQKPFQPRVFEQLWEIAPVVAAPAVPPSEEP